MSSTKQGILRENQRGFVKEDMMWQGVRPKAPNVMDESMKANMHQSRQNYAMPSLQGEQSVSVGQPAVGSQ